MKVDIGNLRGSFHESAGARARGHLRTERTSPSLFRYDHLALRTLADDIRTLLERLPPATEGTRALDLGSSNSPYGEWIEARGYRLETLDSDPRAGADHTGEAADTGLPDHAFDLVICTQVLEHVPDPRAVLNEIVRILRPGGVLVASTPHVWFYHPHPGDYWRFTPEGVVELCRQAALEPVELRAQGGSLTTFLQAFNFLAYGVLGKLGAPLYLAVNLLGGLVRPFDRNTLFSHNFAWYATRR